MIRKDHFFRRIQRRYDVATETLFYRRLQDVVDRTSSKRRKSDVSSEG